MSFALVLLGGTASHAAVPPEVVGHPEVPPDFVGVTSADTFGFEGQYRSSAMARQRSAGIGLVRQVFDWSHIEMAPGRYHFDAYDAYVREAAAQGLAVLPILQNAPSFHSPRSGRTACAPSRMEDMADFADALARRYGPGGSLWRERPDAPSMPIRAWQIWNEPNVGVGWCNQPNPREYAAMLRAAGGAIERANPGAEIVTAGISASRMKTAMPLGRFIDGLYRAGGKRYFDTLAVNGYAPDHLGLAGLLHRVRRLMDGRRDRRADIRITEIGWGDAGPRHRFIVGPVGQARRIRHSLALISQLRRKLRLRGFAYYAWRDLPPYPPLYRDLWGLHTGLLDAHDNAKPAFRSFVRGVAALR